MPKETDEVPVLAVNGDRDVQPSWVAAFQTSMQTWLVCKLIWMLAGKIWKLNWTR